MLRLTLPGVALSLCLPAAAQEDHFTSSPQGFEGVEGNMSIDLLGREPLLRYQQIDAFTFGAKTNRSRIYFRRDGLLPTNPTYGPRTVELEIVIAESDLSTMSTSFSANYKNGISQIVFNRKQYSFPDWSAAPALPPQAEAQALIIPTDVVGWSYPGKSASGTDFLWEVKVWSNDKAGTGYPMDADTVVPTNVGATGGTVVGSSCTATGAGSSANAHLDMANFGTHFTMHLDVANLEPNQVSAMFLGAVLQSTNLGLCGNLELVPVLGISLPLTDPTGFAELNFNNLTHSAALIGQTIYGQGVGLDSGQGLVLTTTRGVTVPINPPAGSQVKYMYSLDPHASTATSGILPGGIILHTNHP